MVRKQAILFFSLVLLFHTAKTQDSTKTIYVHFLYGSVPAKKYKDTEKKWFGGKHGGHVTVEVNNFVYGFNPRGRYHYFPHKNNKHGAWAKEKNTSFLRDTVDMRYASFAIQISEKQCKELDSTLNVYYKTPPRDYSFLGFRCASSTWEVLEDIGILKKHSDLWKAWVIFYPRRIRKRMLRMNEEKGWTLTLKEGSERRKWEKDLGKKGF